MMILWVNVCFSSQWYKISIFLFYLCQSHHSQFILYTHSTFIVGWFYIETNTEWPSMKFLVTLGSVCYRRESLWLAQIGKQTEPGVIVFRNFILGHPVFVLYLTKTSTTNHKMWFILTMLRWLMIATFQLTKGWLKAIFHDAQVIFMPWKKSKSKGFKWIF